MNGIFIQTPTSKPPLFNYISFGKVLSIDAISQTIENSNQVNNTYLMLQELLKAFMNQISSLKALRYSREFQGISFINFPGAKDCLTDLSAFDCYSDTCSNFFHQLSQICYNIQTLIIIIENCISNGLKELISLQNNLKHLELIIFGYEGWTDIIPALTKHYNTLKKLYIQVNGRNGSLSFITAFKNLQELVIATSRINIFHEIEFQNVIFSNLQVLNVPYGNLVDDVFTKFLENNGTNLVELNILNTGKIVKSSIAQLCPNLKKIFTLFSNYELDILKAIFNGFQYLESIVVWCGDDYLNGKGVKKFISFNHISSRFVHSSVEPGLSYNLIP